MLLYLVIIAIILCILHVLINYNERARMLKKIPGPDYVFIFGNALRIIRSSADVMDLGREYAKTFNGIFRLWTPPFGSVIIYNPEDVETIISNVKYNEKSDVYALLKPWLQDGLLLSSGVKWQERRKILTPAFHFNILRQFCDIFEENSQRLLVNLKQTAGRPVDISAVVSEFTLHSICETAMGTQLNADISGKSYKDAIYSLGELFVQRFTKIYLFADPLFYLTPYAKQQERHLETVHNFTKTVIQIRKEYVTKHGFDTSNENVVEDEVYIYKKKKKTAMLDLLLSAEREGLIDKKGIQEEVDTFMFEGHDTTASGLTFCFMLLANHKEVQDKIVSELDEIFGDSNRRVTMEDLPKMKYLECCIKESLRLYPPVHFISRKLNDTTTLSNYKIPAGTFCHILILDLHRRPDLFEDPEKFDPDRFLPKNSIGRHPYSYIPFSAGPRNCIGQKFAMMEMKIAITEVLRKFQVEPVTHPSEISFISDIVLRSKETVLVNFVQRHNNNNS